MKPAQQPRRGTILVLAAACMVLIFAFVAFTVDVGYIALARGELQNAADAAALAGAQALEDGRGEAVAAAKAVAAENRAAKTPVVVLDEDVQIGRWDEKTASFLPLSGQDLDEADAVRVDCRRSADRGTGLSLFFAPVLGIPQTSVQTHAVARLKAPKCGGVFGSDSVRLQGSILTDSYDSDLGPYSPQTAGRQGHVCSNGAIDLQGAATVNGNAHPGPDHEVSMKGASTVTGDTTPLTEPVEIPPVDPGDAAWSNDNEAIPPTDGGRDAVDADNAFSIGGNDSVELPPGTYHFSAMSIGGNATVRITGPTVIYVTGDSELAGTGVVNDTQVPGNLQLHSMGSEVKVYGSSDWHGLVYAPDARVHVQGAAEVFGMVVGREVELQGGRNAGVHVDEALTKRFPIFPRRAVLVE
jgi:hypothetical protein